MTQHTMSGFGRHFDLSLRSNRIAIGGSFAAFAVLAARSFVDADLSIVGAAAASVAVFLGWAIGRELDPDRTGVATVGMALSLLFALFATPSAAMTAVAMLALRMIVGSVGSAVSSVDVGVLFLLGAVAGSKATVWIVGIAIAMWLASAPEVGRRRRVAIIVFAMGVAAGLGYAWWQSGSPGSTAEVTGAAYALAAIAAAVMLLAARPSPVTSSDDRGSSIINTDRVRLARLAAGSFCMWAAVMGGVAGFWAIGPVFAALTATAIYRTVKPPT